MNELEKFTESYLTTGNFQFITDSVKLCKQEKAYSIGIALIKEYLGLYPKNSILQYELASFFELNGEYQNAFDIYCDLLKDRSIKMCPLFLSSRKKRISSEKSLLNRYIDYPREKINDITNRPKKEARFITLTMTTCKRFSLFQQTINSFISCCSDLELIDSWICIDDNSSEEDRQKMKELYPFFQFIFKTPHEKGHPQSMNILVQEVKTPFFFHLEDDWKFFQKLPYLTLCAEVLAEDNSYGQCLINKNFSETEHDSILGGESRRTQDGLRYIFHEFCPTDELQKDFTKRNGFGSFVHYWPHFSLRPGLYRTSVFQKQGKCFDEKVSHFERVYANKYYERGLRTVFLEDIYSIHIGRLTSERNDETKLNAYILNGEKQFSGKEEEQKKLAVRTTVINLDRRKDRWEKFQSYDEPKFLHYGRLSAVDGNTLLPTEQLQRIFEGNDYNMRAGMVGCAMSHIKLYIDLVNSQDDIFCILEDDIIFCKDFQTRFVNLIGLLGNTNWDFCYLGHHLWSQTEFNKDIPLQVEKRNAEEALKNSIGGTGGYLITKRGAEKLLKFINGFGMRNGIDTIQQKSADFLNVYYCSPHLIYSECWTNNNNSDTDIQKDYKSLTIPIHTRLIAEKEFYSKYNPRQTFDFAEAMKFAQESNKTKENQVLFFVSSKASIPNNPRSIKYEKSEVELIVEQCIHPCYSLEFRVLVIVQNPTDEIKKNRMFDRLKINGKFSINSALSLPSIALQDCVIIPFGEMTHITEAIPDVLDLPFNKLDGLTLDNAVKITQILLEMDSEQLQLFANEFCSPKLNSTYVQTFNNKTVVRNEKFTVTFPHDENQTIVQDYFNRFSTYVSLLKENKHIKFVFGTRFKEDCNNLFSVLIRSIKNINPLVKLEILSINGLSKLPEVTFVDIPFPDKFRGSDWSNDKIQYDQSIFRLDVQKPILEFIHL